MTTTIEAVVNPIGIGMKWLIRPGYSATRLASLRLSCQPAKLHERIPISRSTERSARSNVSRIFVFLSLIAVGCGVSFAVDAAEADERGEGCHQKSTWAAMWLLNWCTSRREILMGSTPEEKAWATGIEGGAQPGTERESYEGEQPRLMRVKRRLLDGAHRSQRGAVSALRGGDSAMSATRKNPAATPSVSIRNGTAITSRRRWCIRGSRCRARAGAIRTLGFP